MTLAGAALLLGAQSLMAQTPAAPDAPAPQAATAAAATATSGGTIHGTVKAGTTPLPGVAITATNTLTGKKYTTTTDIDGNYAMTIPRTGRYVVKAELAAFAPLTSEVRITAETTDQVAAFTLQLASRAAAQAAGENAAGANAIAQAATALGRGTQALNMLGGDANQTDASVGGGATDAALPSLAGLNGGGDAAAASSDSVAVSGQMGQTNALGAMNEDQIRQRVEDAVAQARQQGGGQGDQVSVVVSMLGNIIGGGGGLGGPGGGPGGGRGGRGGGGGAFRNFNPAQPHGAIFYQGGNSALNSARWSPTLLPQPKPSAYSNRFGASLAGSPYIPGLTKPDTRQFVFLNLTGQKNVEAYLPNPVRVPTVDERSGDFSNSYQLVNGKLTRVAIFDPITGAPIRSVIPPCPTPPAVATGPCITRQAQALLALYPAPNITTIDPTAYNYQTLSNAGTNNIAINTRYQRQLGKATAGGPFGGFGGGGARGQRGQNGNAPPVLRQSINAAYNYMHSANDNRNIFLALGGANSSDGHGLNVGYSINYGRLSNNASVNWNRSNSRTRNYFTDTSNNPTSTAQICVPNGSTSASACTASSGTSFADPNFYNGLPSIGISNFAGFNNQAPSQSVSQTISLSDSIGWRHKKHNFRFGGDFRRVHADSIGGNNPLGSFQFSGYATESKADQQNTGTQATTGSGFADFLLGRPTQTTLQAGLNKVYLRESVYDLFAQDDFRVLPNITLNFGLRYEYFGPYSEKNNHLVNLDHNADFTLVAPVFPGGNGPYQGQYPTGLVNPDRTMFAPRIGIAWSPKFKYTKNTVVRTGYGINYNTGQFASFARALSFQPPFAATQTNTLTTPGCAGITLANGFNCATTAIQNNFSVNKDYRLGMVQVYNLDIQRTLPQGIVLNIGYNGSKGSNLDVVRAPNHTVSSVTTTNAEAFRYEDSIAGSHLNQLLVSLQQRQRKGISLGATYTYSHSIDNAGSIGGGIGQTAQNDKRLDLEEGNSSFDQRHLLSGNWTIELPFGPNREFLNKGGVMAYLLNGFSLSGNFTFGSGNYFTPSYSSSAAQLLGGGTYTLRPDRVFSQPINGLGKLSSYFNKAAFVAPQVGAFGTASRNSIEGPGTVSTNASLSRTFTLGSTRSAEARVSANNVFNTVQYNGINTRVDSANYGQVTSAAGMRTLQVQARYRF